MVTLTDGAAEKLLELMAGRGEDEQVLRLYVKPGGCSGFSYGMALDEVHEGDEVCEIKGVRVAIASDSLELVNGSEIDYVNDITGQGFRILNPNATTTCGCGSSFRTATNPGVPGSCE
ncbi:MAG: iron-sulfur cluster assembly accessory protein [Alicyclobacillaceae bacterium]|nr:iron-sulfur cluster assembly accessory protein [Alicyclobacillaceae bacterium]